MDAMTNEETLARVASISTPAEAIEMAEAGWWKGIPSKDVALAALRQPLLCLPFGDFHRIVEEAIGGPVWTHEFARSDDLIRRIENGSGSRSPFSTLGDILLRRTRVGRWVVDGRTYRTKALAMRSITGPAIVLAGEQGGK